jgi:uncharacterized protein
VTISDRGRSGLLRGPAAYQPSTPWRPIWALVATALIVAISVVVAVLVTGAAGPHAGGAALPSRARPGSLEINAIATLAVWQGTTIMLAILASCLFGGRVRNVLALYVPAGAPRVYLSAILAMAALQVLMSIVQYNVITRDMFADLRPFVDIAAGPNWILALGVVGIGAPLSEELLFRGFLQSALAQSRLGFWGGAVVSSALWTGLHAGYTLAGIIEVFSIGLFFSWLLWRTGSLKVPIFCHALYNSLIVVVLRHVPLPA